MYELKITPGEETESKGMEPVIIYDEDYTELARVGAKFVDAGYAITVEKVDEE